MFDHWLLPLLTGFILALVQPWLSRKRRLRTHWSAIRAEIDGCSHKAKTLLADKVTAPLYRLPTVAYETSFPVLLVDGAISEEDITIVSDFYDMVQQLNRGLDAAANEPNDTRVMAHHKRNKLKAGHIIDAEGDRPSRYDRARAVVNQKLEARWWRTDRHD